MSRITSGDRWLDRGARSARPAGPRAPGRGRATAAPGWPAVPGWASRGGYPTRRYRKARDPVAEAASRRLGDLAGTVPGRPLPGSRPRAKEVVSFRLAHGPATSGVPHGRDRGRSRRGPMAVPAGLGRAGGSRGLPRAEARGAAGMPGHGGLHVGSVGARQRVAVGQVRVAVRRRRDGTVPGLLAGWLASSSRTITRNGMRMTAVVPRTPTRRNTPDLAPRGELADHEQAELLAAGPGRTRRAGQVLVDLRELVVVMPRPRSSTSATRPAPTRSARTSIRVLGGEKAVAFSTSSAMRWMTSLTASPATVARPALHVDPHVVLDLGDRRAQHVDDGDRVTPAVAGAEPDKMMRPSASGACGW